MPFFTLTLNFVLILLLIREEFNTIMSVTCKFSKQVTLIEYADIWLAEKQAYIFPRHLDLINKGFLEELIFDCNPKFLNKFWTALFTKLGVKLFYSIAYHPQIDKSSKYTNQTVEIALHFFIQAFKDASHQPKVLSCIQSILNNISFFTTGKTLNKIVYRFLSRRSSNLLSALPLPDIYIAQTNVVDAIFFTFANQKVYLTGNTSLFL